MEGFALGVFMFLVAGMFWSDCIFNYGVRSGKASIICEPGIVQTRLGDGRAVCRFADDRVEIRRYAKDPH